MQRVGQFCKHYLLDEVIQVCQEDNAVWKSSSSDALGSYTLETVYRRGIIRKLPLCLLSHWKGTRRKTRSVQLAIQILTARKR